MTGSVHSQRPMVVYSVPDQYTSTSDTETEAHLPEVHGEITCGLDTGLVGLEPEISNF